MYQKFIINNGRLIIGRVDQHRELASDHRTTLGGGWWHIDQTKRSIWLYGRSQLFGYVSKEVICNVIAAGQHDYPGYTFYFSHANSVNTAIKNGEKCN